jgi:hypothetical protein
VGGACSTDGKAEKIHTKWSQNLKGMVNLDIDGRLVLEWILEGVWVYMA